MNATSYEMIVQEAGSHELNRPVHLALRDACAERAVELLSQPIHHIDTANRAMLVERIIALLRTAALHARLAARSERAGEQERDFLHFLLLTLQHVESVYALIQNQADMESREHGFLTKFLGVSADEVTLTALNYRRRAEDMLEGLWHVLRLSGAPYRVLQQTNLAEMSESDRERYRRARESYRAELDKAPRFATASVDSEPSVRNAEPPLASGATEFTI